MNIDILSITIFSFAMFYFYHKAYFGIVSKINFVYILLFLMPVLYYAIFDNYLIAIFFQLIISLVYYSLLQGRLKTENIFMVLLILFIKLFAYVFITLFLNLVSYYLIFPSSYSILLIDLLFLVMLIPTINFYKKYLIKISEYKSLYEVFHIVLMFVYIAYLIIILIKKETVFLTIIELLLITVLIIVIYRLIDKIASIEKDNYSIKLYNEALKYSQKNYEQINNSIIEVKKIKHDMNHFLLMLIDYYKDGEYEKINKSLQSQLSLVNQGNYNINTGNNSLDLIISSRLSKMKNEGIEFITSSLNESIGIDMLDFYTMIGNLLDNAIENCSSHNIKKILLDIYVEDDFLYLNIKNSCLNNPLVSNPKFKTTKLDTENHGLGIVTIEKIVHKYEGEILYHYSLNYFNVNIKMSNKS